MQHHVKSEWKLNTSNQNKFNEFKQLFAQHGCTLVATHVDLPEIAADPLSVITHKASQMDEDVLVEDTSLEIEGAEVGINVRWMMNHLSAYIGRKSVWRVLLAYQKREQVFVFQGLVHGKIVSPQGDSAFGFDPIFMPEGATQTLAQAKPENYNARALAVAALIRHEVFQTLPLIKEWNGDWQ